MGKAQTKKDLKIRKSELDSLIQSLGLNERFYEKINSSILQFKDDPKVIKLLEKWAKKEKKGKAITKKEKKQFYNSIIKKIVMPSIKDLFDVCFIKFNIYENVDDEKYIKRLSLKTLPYILLNSLYLNGGRFEKKGENLINEYSTLKKRDNKLNKKTIKQLTLLQNKLFTKRLDGKVVKNLKKRSSLLWIIKFLIYYTVIEMTNKMYQMKNENNFRGMMHLLNTETITDSRFIGTILKEKGEKLVDKKKKENYSGWVNGDVYLNLILLKQAINFKDKKNFADGGWERLIRKKREIYNKKEKNNIGKNYKPDMNPQKLEQYDITLEEAKFVYNIIKKLANKVPEIKKINKLTVGNQDKLFSKVGKDLNIGVYSGLVGFLIYNKKNKLFFSINNNQYALDKRFRKSPTEEWDKEYPWIDLRKDSFIYYDGSKTHNNKLKIKKLKKIIDKTFK